MSWMVNKWQLLWRPIGGAVWWVRICAVTCVFLLLTCVGACLLRLHPAGHIPATLLCSFMRCHPRPATPIALINTPPPASVFNTPLFLCPTPLSVLLVSHPPRTTSAPSITPLNPSPLPPPPPTPPISNMYPSRWAVDQLDQRAPSLVEWMLWLQGLISLGLHVITVGVNLGVIWVGEPEIVVRSRSRVVHNSMQWWQQCPTMPCQAAHTNTHTHTRITRSLARAAHTLLQARQYN